LEVRPDGRQTAGIIRPGEATLYDPAKAGLYYRLEWVIQAILQPKMPEVTPLTPELVRTVAALSRTLVAAARSWSLYPAEHPALLASVDRFRTSLAAATAGSVLSFGVTPETLLVDGIPVGLDGPVHEAAMWLHEHDVLQLTFDGEVSLDAIQALLALLSDDIGNVRARGGPAVAWLETPHRSVTIEQIDFAKVFEDRAVERPVRRKDDLWLSIVRAVTDRREVLDEAVQQRLLEIAGDIVAIGQLARDVMAPNAAADGSPMLTSQAAAVMVAYRHLVNIVDVMDPARRAEVMDNVTAATSSLDPRVILQMLAGENDASPGESGGLTIADIRSRVAAGLDDSKVAQLLATTLAIDGLASNRLADVFDRIVADATRKRRVLRLTKTLLADTTFGQAQQFETLWASMEHLLLTHDSEPFVSPAYKTTLDEAGSRGDAMAGDIPADMLALIDTLSPDNVRRLSVTLLVDLLKLERDATRAPGLARDVAALGEDLLMAGDYPSALAVARALAAQAVTDGSVTREGSAVALGELVESAGFQEAVDALGDIEPADAACIGDIAETAGPAAATMLSRQLDVEEKTPGRERATKILHRLGAGAASKLDALLSSPNWFAQCNAAELLGELQVADAVPFLQPLLRGRDPRVMRAAVRALSSIDDPAAARAIHTVLRASTGAQRQAVVAALVAERDPRVVPVLVCILNESQPFGTDHQIVIEALGAIAEVGRDHAVPHVAALMRKRSWLAPRRTRALKEVSLQTLQRVGTPVAKRAIADAMVNGDRLLRKLARAAAGTHG
jgi:HEAT repeat protein